MSPIIIVCIVAFVIVVGGKAVATNIVMNKLTKHLYMREDKRFEELRNSKLASAFIHPFNLRFIDLSKAIFDVDTKEVKKAEENLELLRLNIKQKEMVYTRCFYYYLSIEDYKDAKKEYEKIKELDPEKDNLEIDRLYDTYINKGSKYLNETIEELDKAKLDIRPNLESVIAKMYENIGDNEKAEKYIELAEKDINKLEQIMNSKNKIR